MWRNYLSAALRNLNRNRAYAAINLFGLALGFATALLIGLYVVFEYSFDAFWPNYERMFLMTQTLQTPGKAPLTFNFTQAHVAAALKSDFPEIDLVARAMAAGQFVLKHGDVKTTLTNRAYWVDPDFFGVFPIHAIAGDLATALRRPDGFVITRSTARQIFGRESVVGEKLGLGDDQVVEVTAVIEDWPSNSYFDAAAFGSGLASFSGIATEDARAADPKAGKGDNMMTFGRLRPGAKLADLNRAMDDFVGRHFPAKETSADSGGQRILALVRLDRVHFVPTSLGGIGARPIGDERALQGMMAIAVLIVMVAASNFINMMTARASRRAIEVGVRKSVGGIRRQLMAQFMAEALGFTFLAVGLAVGAVVLVLPALRLFLDRDLARGFSPSFLIGGALTALVTGLLAGSYPAFVLSSFRPIAVLKGTIFAPTGSGRLRQGLVTGQFAVLIALILATLVIYRQTDYAIHQRLRSAGDQIYMAGVGLPCSDQTVQRVERVPGVRTAGCAAMYAAGFGRASATIVLPDGRKDAGFASGMVDEAYFQVFGLTPLAGRLLATDFGADEVLRGNPNSATNPNVVINEAAVKALGYTTPDSAVGQRLRWRRNSAYREGIADVDLEPSDSEIVGVIPDFGMTSARNRIEPMVYYVDPSQYRVLVTSLDGARMPEAVKGIQEAYAQLTGGQPYNGVFYSQFMAFLNLDILKQAAIFGAFAIVAVVIGCLGLFALAVFTAERFTKEIGIRKAMGASRIDILRFVGWRFVRPVLLANVFAWPMAYVFMRRWLDGFAYHVAIEFSLFLWAGLAAVVIALVTISGQSIMVARAKPVRALRYE